MSTLARKLTRPIYGLILSVGMILLASSIAFAEDLYVSSTGTGTTCSLVAPCLITTALADARVNPGDGIDTIHFAAGQYNHSSQIDITEDVILSGAGIDQTIIVPSSSYQYTFYYTGSITNAAVLENMTIKVCNSTSYTGIYLYNAASPTIRNNKILPAGGNSGYGIGVGGSGTSTAKIENNQIYSLYANGIDISLSGAGSCSSTDQLNCVVIKNNILSQITTTSGSAIKVSGNAYVYNNIITGNRSSKAIEINGTNSKALNNTIMYHDDDNAIYANYAGSIIRNNVIHGPYPSGGAQVSGTGSSFDNNLLYSASVSCTSGCTQSNTVSKFFEPFVPSNSFGTVASYSSTSNTERVYISEALGWNEDEWNSSGEVNFLIHNYYGTEEAHPIFDSGCEMTKSGETNVCDAGELYVDIYIRSYTPISSGSKVRISNLQPSYQSPAVDAGSSDVNGDLDIDGGATWPLDMYGHTRVNDIADDTANGITIGDGTRDIDIGALEYVSGHPTADNTANYNNTHYAAPSGSNSADCSNPSAACTLERAISKADTRGTTSDTIYLTEGTYSSPIVLNRSISLKGTNRDTTIIATPAGQIPLTLYYVDETATISNLTIKTFGSGIVMTASSPKIDNNTIIGLNPSGNSGNGIKNTAAIGDHPHPHITNNRIVGFKDYGIQFAYTYGWTGTACSATDQTNCPVIKNNIISKSRKGAFYNDYATYIYIHNNILVGNNMPETATYLLRTYTNSYIFNNTIFGNSLYQTNAYLIYNDHSSLINNNIFAYNAGGLAYCGGSFNNNNRYSNTGPGSTCSENSSNYTQPTFDWGSTYTIGSIAQPDATNDPAGYRITFNEDPAWTANALVGQFLVAAADGHCTNNNTNVYYITANGTNTADIRVYDSTEVTDFLCANPSTGRHMNVTQFKITAPLNTGSATTDSTIDLDAIWTTDFYGNSRLWNSSAIDVGATENNGSGPTLTSIVIADSSSGVTKDATPNITITSTGSPTHVAFSCDFGDHWSTWIAYPSDNIINNDGDEFNITDGATACTASDAPKEIWAKLKDAGAAESSIKADRTTYDTTGPVVLSLSASTGNGSYTTDGVIDITATFNEPVTITNTPRIQLETGTTDRYANYQGGTGTTTITFRYTVISGDATADLDAKGTTALELNGGTITDEIENAATLTLPTPAGANSLGLNKNIIVDTTPSQVTAVNATTNNGSYKIDGIIYITAAFDEAVTATGSPRILLETGTTDRYATLSGGSGTSTLTFSYTVQSGDTSSDLDYVGTDSFELNSGTIVDAAGNAAILTLATPGAAGSLAANKDIVIDTALPYVTSVTSTKDDGTYYVGNTIDVVVNFNENVTVTNVPRIQLETGTTDRQVDYTSGSGGTALTFRYTVQTEDSSSDLDYHGTDALNLNSGFIRDNAGNDATLTLAATGDAGSISISKAIIIDGIPPSTPSVTGATPTNLVRPTWTWSAEGGGNGTFRYKLDSSDLSTGATETSSLTYTPTTDLSEAAHTLYVQERNTVGNWSYSGAFAITLDLTPPSTPSLTATSPTGDTTPTWSWSATGGGNGTFRYKFDDSDLTSGATETTGTEYTHPTPFNNTDSHTLYVQERDATGNWSSTASKTIVIDTVPPTKPSVYGTTPTNYSPYWSWTPGGGGNGTYRYKLNSSDLTSGATEVNYTGYNYYSAGDGASTLYVQERDAAGNWSESGSFEIVKDSTPPSAPVPTNTSAETTDSTPTWTWTHGTTPGNGTYRYQLDNSYVGYGAPETTEGSYTPGSALSGTHTLYFQERDAAGNWSETGSFAITIDNTPPNAPVVSGTTPTDDMTPTWSWVASGGGNGTFRYKLDDSDLSAGATETTGLSYTPAEDLSSGIHTLYVQEMDSVGNWSASGSRAITALAYGPPHLTSFDCTGSYQIGRTYDVRWEGTGPIKIEYSTDDFDTATTIVASTNEKPYVWAIDGGLAESATMKIRISMVSAPSITDESEANLNFQKADVIGEPMCFDFQRSADYTAAVDSIIENGFANLQSSGDIPGWSYMMPIEVNDLSGTQLTNYQVLIQLTSSNGDLFSHAKSDGGDLRFTDSAGQELSYWLKSYNSGDQTADIWVKVPSIPASDTATIKMYYGKADATTTSDPSSTMIWYDDFESGSLTNYTHSGTLGWISATDFFNGGSKSAGSDAAIGSSQNSSMEKTLISNTGMRIQFYWKVSSESCCDYLRFYTDGTQQGSIAGETAWAVSNTTVATSGSKVLRWDYSKDGSVDGIYDRGWIDDLIVREYASTEPGITVGAEELMTYPTTNPSVVSEITIPYKALLAFSEGLGTENAGSVNYQLSPDAGTAWYYWDGSAWTETTSGYSASNDAATINTNITTLASQLGVGNLAIKAFLHSDSTQAVELGWTSVLTNLNTHPTISSLTALTGSSEDTPFTITYAALAAAADEIDADNDAISFRVESVSSGTLTKGGVAVEAGTTMLSTGEELVWTPEANANGTIAAFTIRAYDGTSLSVSTVAVNVTVSSINDAPSFTAGSSTLSIESGLSYSATWATNMSTGPASESNQSVLGFIVNNNNNSLFTSQPTIAANGTLTFATATNTSGSALVSIRMQDSGGTEGGGTDLSTIQSLTINVTASAEPPSEPTEPTDDDTGDDTGGDTPEDSTDDVDDNSGDTGSDTPTSSTTENVIPLKIITTDMDPVDEDILGSIDGYTIVRSSDGLTLRFISSEIALTEITSSTASEFTLLMPIADLSDKDFHILHLADGSSLIITGSPSADSGDGAIWIIDPIAAANASGTINVDSSAAAIKITGEEQSGLRLFGIADLDRDGNSDILMIAGDGGEAYIGGLFAPISSSMTFNRAASAFVIAGSNIDQAVFLGANEVDTIGGLLEEKTFVNILFPGAASLSIDFTEDVLESGETSLDTMIADLEAEGRGTTSTGFNEVEPLEIAGEETRAVQNTGGGDINGDGYSDIVYGDPTAGKIYLFYGTEIFSGLGDAIDADVTITCPTDDTSCGYSIIVDEIDGDSYSDIIIGNPLSYGENGDIENAGSLFIIHGSDSLPSSINLESDEDLQSIFGTLENGYLGANIIVTGSELICKQAGGSTFAMSFETMSGRSQAIVVEESDSPIATTASDPSELVVMLQIKLGATAVEDLSVNTIRITSTGSGMNSSLQINAYLYKDVNNDGALDDGDEFIAGPKVFAADNTILFSDLGRTITKSTKEQWLLGYAFTPITIDEGAQMSIAISKGSTPATLFIAAMALILAMMLISKSSRIGSRVAMLLILGMLIAGQGCLNHDEDGASESAGSFTFQASIASADDIGATGAATGRAAKIFGANVTGNVVTVNISEGFAADNSTAMMQGSGGCSLMF